jgi:hypothetical protein
MLVSHAFQRAMQLVKRLIDFVKDWCQLLPLFLGELGIVFGHVLPPRCRK